MVGGNCRLAFAFGHRGDTFHGSQVQPNLRTVQSSLQEALYELGFIKKANASGQPCILSSRTDAGVHVRMNIAAIDIPETSWNSMGEAGFLTAMNDQLDGDIVVWAAQKAGDNWNPRRAISRTYRYRLEGCFDWRGAEKKQFSEWLNIFVGQHDFNNFRRVDEVPSTVREILSLKPWIENEIIIGFEIQGRAFLWNMVRRIAAALCGLSKGVFTVEKVIQALNEPNVEHDLGLAVADWLVLWEVEHEEINLSQKARELILEHPLSRPPNKYDNRANDRWIERAKLEQIMLCHSEWEGLIS
jgi:tRNA pseudouridine38-40 synthase